MSDENVALLHRLVDAINFDAIPRDLLTEDFELKNATTAVTDATYHGYDGAIQWCSGRIARAEGYNSRRAALEAVEVQG
jgi:hypothetical protein